MSICPILHGHQASSLTPVTVRFWGVRGSIPTPGPQTARFGGNTSCVEVRADGQLLILDAGSGLRPLGLSLGSEFRDRPQDITMLITHTHWDHIQGFPFFAPAYQSQNRIRVLGCEGARRRLQEALAGQMDSSYFPVALGDLPGNILFEEFDETTMMVGGIRLTTCRTNHPGSCSGYRLDTSCGSICYIPDHETTRDAHGENAAAVAGLIQGADLVILDAQYTQEEYRQHVGWGHGCLDEVVRVACDARVRQLYLFHHDPLHDDEFLDGMLGRARRLAMGTGLRVDSAREGEQVVLERNS